MRITTDLEGKLLSFDSGDTGFLLDADQPMPQKIEDVIHIADYPDLHHLLTKIHTLKKSINTAFRVVDQQRQIHWLTAKINLENDIFTYELNPFEAIASWKHSIRNKLNQLTRKTEELAKVGGWEVDLKTMTPLWSEQVYRIHEVPEDYQPNLEQAVNFYAPEARPIITERFQKSLETGEGYDLELPFITYKGRHIWVRATGRVVFENGVATSAYGTFQDITEEINQKQKLKFLALVAEKTNNIVVVTSAHKKIEWVNDSFVKRTGYTLEEAKGKTPKDLIQGPETDKQVVDLIRNKLSNNEGIATEILNYSKTGQKYWLYIDIQPIFDENKNVTNFIAIQTDITEKVKYQKELEKAKLKAEEATKAKSLFLATMSHEIRTPMNGILGMTQILNETNLSEKQKELVSTIHNSGETLLNILNDLLDFSKIEAGKMEMESIPFSLQECCQETLQLLQHKAKEKNIETIVTFDENLPKFYKGDPSRIKQIILNLYSNAIKFTSNGNIEISVSSPKPHLSLKKKWVKISIKDSGVGIPQEAQHKLFKSFQQADSSTTRKYGGTGLGLSICKKLCDAMNGKIEFTSIENEGSCFFFTIPLDVISINIKKKEGSNNAIADIFVFDKNGQNSKSTIEFFKNANYQPYLVTSEKDLIELQPKISNKNLTIAIFFTDTDYLEIQKSHEKLKELAPNVKTIVIPKTGIRGDFEVYHSYHFNAYLAMPFEFNQLQSIVSTLLAKPANSMILTKFNLLEESTTNKKVRILLVEDNLVNQKVSVLMLQSLGYEAELALNGKECLEMTEKKQYDIILMDCQMPIMDGYEATQTIRKSTSNINQNSAIIALTANAMANDKIKCHEAGMNDFITKPVKKEELKKALERWINTHESQ